MVLSSVFRNRYKKWQAIGCYISLLLLPIQLHAFSSTVCAIHATDAPTSCEATQGCVSRYMQKLEQKFHEREAVEDQVKYLVERAQANAYLEETIYKSVLDIEKAYGLVKKADPGQVSPSIEKNVLYLRGAFALRLGELKNCINNHNADSCIVPLSENARHSEKYGSSLAIKSYTEYLDTYGRDPHVEWLLNLAHQTLGQYPDQVPERYRLPEKVFSSPVDVGRFVDVAGPLGLQKQSLEAGGVAVADFTGNGHLDILIAGLGFCDPVLYFENQGNGSFVDRSGEAGFSGLMNQGGIIPVDYDNNGDTDVYFSAGGWEGEAYRKHLPQKYNTLYRNDGSGNFTEITEKVGLRTGRNHTLGSAWQDFNNDGWVDLIVCNEFAEVELFKNKNGKFQKLDVDLGNREERCKSAAWGDFDNDGWPDLYLSYHGHKNYLYRNKEGKSFEPVNDSIVTEAPLWSFVAWFFDYDNDGWEDLFVADFEARVEFGQQLQGKPFKSATMRLYHNQGDGRFDDVTKSAGLAFPATTMGINYGDINNDGYPDIYLGTGGPTFDQVEPNYLLLNVDGERYVDVTFSAGVGNLQKGHGISFADFNNDGQQDILAQFGGAFPGDRFFPSLYLNPGNDNHWITLRLEGVKANRSAIGARIEVVVEEDGKERSVFQTISHGGSFGSNPLQAQVGLGQADSIKRIVIRWRGNQPAEVIENITMNRIYHIKEGMGEAEPLDLELVKGFGKGESHHHHQQ